MLTRIALLVALSAVMYSHQAAAQEHSILTYHGDARRSGNFIVPSLTWEKARSLHLDQTFNARVVGHLYAQPLYWHVPGSDAAMLLVATEDNIAQAFDALSPPVGQFILTQPSRTPLVLAIDFSDYR